MPIAQRKGWPCIWTSLGLFGIFLSVFIENVGVPLPTEVAYIAVGIMVEQGQSYVVVLLVFIAGHVLGSITAYYLGYFGGNWWVRKMRGNPKVTHVHSVLDDWYKHHGALTIFATRFIGYVRP